MSTENSYSNILAASKSESILAVIEGLPVDANGYFLTDEQMQNIDAALAEVETHKANAADFQTLNEQNRQALELAQTTLAENEQTIASLNARIVALEAADGTPGANPEAKEKDDFAAVITPLNNPNSSLNQMAAAVGL